MWKVRNDSFGFGSSDSLNIWRDKHFSLLNLCLLWWFLKAGRSLGCDFFLYYIYVYICIRILYMYTIHIYICIYIYIIYMYTIYIHMYIHICNVYVYYIFFHSMLANISVGTQKKRVFLLQKKAVPSGHQLEKLLSGIQGGVDRKSSRWLETVSLAFAATSEGGASCRQGERAI